MSSRLRLVVLTFLAVGFFPAAQAEVKLPAVFCSHMVLQQGLPVPVWGTAGPGDTVRVAFAGQTASATADATGKWQVELKPLQANSTPQTLTVTGSNTVTIDDVLVGEVWLGSGQSNMAYALGKAASKHARLSRMRLFQVPAKFERRPAATVDAEWVPCQPETAAGFSAVLFHFGHQLHSELDVPIGLIQATKGSTGIEPFLPPPRTGPLFNGSIGPLAPFAIRGFLWYQGEANVQGGGPAYAEKLTMLIEGWRKAWGREVPFYLVQLAPATLYEPDTLPPVWEAQAAALKLPHTGMVVTTDLAGNMANIHPPNKADVGLRLARWALAKDYGHKEIVYSGPLYKGMTAEGNTARLTFADAEGLKSRDGKPLTEFEVAGPDGAFVPATATIADKVVVVTAAGVTTPAKVRFAWRNTPSPNLVNGAGLPAAPFHSDGWTGGNGSGL